MDFKLINNDPPQQNLNSWTIRHGLVKVCKELRDHHNFDKIVTFVITN